MTIRFPALETAKTKTVGVTAFSGLNHNLRIKSNEFYAMRNMCGELLPVMSSRPKRRRLRTLLSPNGLFAHEKLCWVDGDSFYYDGQVKGTVANSPKQFVRMGAYVLIWPDKVYYNTRTDEFGTLEAAYASTGEVQAALCRSDGTAYSEYITSDTEPENPENAALWLDTGVSPAVLRQYAASTGMWMTIPTVYTRIQAPGIGKAFQQHDGVTLSGFADEALNGVFYLVAAQEDFIVIAALLPQPLCQTESITVRREVPDLDFLAEHDNRIWGCNSEKHEIYASALGDPKNWNQFMGLSTDSYAVTVGSTGAFTGAASHMGMILFFKENAIHQIMGTRPANYQLDTTNCRGVAAGSENSLCRLNETLLYLSTEDVCLFNSALPTGISKPLGTLRYSAGAAGVLDSCYYLSATDSRGGRHLYVYNAKTDVWIREDNTYALWFATLEHDLYMLDADGVLWSLTGNPLYDDSDARDEDDVEWMLQTGDIGFETQANQYVSAIQLRAECEAHSSLNVAIQYNGKGEWRQIYTHTPDVCQSMVIPIIPERARTVRLRLYGRGDFRLYSMTMRIKKGSDVYGCAR